MTSFIAITLASLAAGGPASGGPVWGGSETSHARIGAGPDPAFEAPYLVEFDFQPTDSLPDPPTWGYLTISGGPYIGIDEDAHLVEVGLEWRFPEYSHLTPLVGATWFEGGDLYFYGGLRWEIPLGEHFYIAPGFALGHYEAGELDLGYPLEFRSSIEVGLQVASSVRLGVTAAHISNADLGDDNPGRNSVSLTVAFRPLALFD